MKKILLSCSLISTMLVSNVFANDTNLFSGDSLNIENIQSYIDDNEDSINEYLSSLDEYINEKEKETRAFPHTMYGALNVTVFQQETSYYCGPATVKQVIHYINGSSKTQSQYASMLKTTTSGTDMTLIPNVLRQETGYNYVYIANATDDYSNWLYQLQRSVDVGRPAIIDVKDSSATVLPYSTNGHFVNISGYSTNSELRITDPYAPGLGNRWYSTNGLHSINHAHFRKAIIVS